MHNPKTIFKVLVALVVVALVLYVLRGRLTIDLDPPGEE